MIQFDFNSIHYVINVFTYTCSQNGNQIESKGEKITTTTAVVAAAKNE